MELKQTTTATPTRTSPNKRFNDQTNGSARAFSILMHFSSMKQQREMTKFYVF